MGFIIRCEQCENEVELHRTDATNRIGQNDKKSFPTPMELLAIVEIRSTTIYQRNFSFK